MDICSAACGFDLFCVDRYYINMLGVACVTPWCTLQGWPTKVLKAMGQHLNIKAHVGAIVSPLHANMVVAHTKTEVAIHTLQTVLKRNR